MADRLSRPIRVGIIGLGYWGPNLLRILSDMEEVELSHLCDVDAQRLGRFARRHSDARATTDPSEVIDDPSVDAVIIVTPIHTHVDLASRSLRAGKHTFVEKPLAASTDDADRLIQLAEEQERLLMCGLTFLYSPPVRAVKALFDAGEIGSVYFISTTRVNLGPYRHDASVLWDLGPHDFAILLFWLEEMPTSVLAVGRDAIAKDNADVAFVSLGFPSGIIANVELSWLAPSKMRRATIVGSKKMVVYEDGSPEPIKVYDHGIVYDEPESFGEYHLSYRTGDILIPHVEAREPLAEELADFVAAVRDGVLRHRFSGLARNVVALVEHAEASMRSGGVRSHISDRSPFLVGSAQDCHERDAAA